MRYLNGFMIIGVALLALSLGGLFTHNRLLTEPGQATNPYAWLQYLAASVLMLVNGFVSIWSAGRSDRQPPAAKDAEPAKESAKD